MVFGVQEKKSTDLLLELVLAKLLIVSNFNSYYEMFSDKSI